MSFLLARMPPFALSRLELFSTGLLGVAIPLICPEIRV